MRTVILDGHTLNPGELSWDELKQYGDVEVFPRTPENEIAVRLNDADAVLTNKAPVTAATIAACPRLKYIGVTATGYNIIDVDAARKAGIVVTTSPVTAPRRSRKRSSRCSSRSRTMPDIMPASYARARGPAAPISPLPTSRSSASRA